MIYSPVYSRSTTYLYLSVVCILAPSAFNLTAVIDYGQISNKHTILRTVPILGAVEGSTYFDINGNGAALFEARCLLEGIR